MHGEEVSLILSQVGLMSCLCVTVRRWYRRVLRGIVRLQALVRMRRHRTAFIAVSSRLRCSDLLVQISLLPSFPPSLLSPQLMEERRATEEEALRKMEEEETERRMAAITGATKRREKGTSARGGEERERAIFPQATSRAPPQPLLDIPAELALILQALSSEC